MEKNKLEFFKQSLTRQLQELNREQHDTVNQLTNEDEVYADWTDVASAETDKRVQLRIRDRERILMTKIIEALERIEAGTFGLCEQCEEEISEPRLLARPVTTLCIDCKSEIEGAEHRYRYS